MRSRTARGVLCCALSGACLACDVGGKVAPEPIGIVLPASGDRGRVEMAVVVEPGAEQSDFVEPLAGAVTRALSSCRRRDPQALHDGIDLRFGLRGAALGQGTAAKPGPVALCLAKQLSGAELAGLSGESLRLQLREVAE